VSAPQRAQADEQAPDDVNGLPVAAVLVILVLSVDIVVGCIGYAVWLGSVQCIKVGGCA
jgi:hypothetical protein